MNKVVLGSTAIAVSELCFGTLPMGPLQANIPYDEGKNLILAALAGDVNFIDTAESYKNYEYINLALKEYKGDVVLSTKSSASTYDAMEKSIQKALKELNVNAIDIFHMHAPRTANYLEERAGALECLLKYKKEGIVRAIGLATHSCEAVRKAVHIKEIDVVHPLINKVGLGIIDGCAGDMVEAIEAVSRLGKGVYAMKSLAGGNLIFELEDAFAFVRENAYIQAIAVGMINMEELRVNLKIFNGEYVAPSLKNSVIKRKKMFIRHDHCKLCGSCIKECPNNAIAIKNERIHIDEQLCLLCGYCSPVCPQLALRMN